MEQLPQFQRNNKKIEMSFVKCPFSVAMASISRDTGVTIVWGKSADDTLIDGVYVGVNIHDLLQTLARRNGLQLSRCGDIYYIGEVSREDNVVVAIRVPYYLDDMQARVKDLLGQNGNCALIGSVLIVTESLQMVEQIVNAVTSAREMLLRSYVAEFYFIKISNSQLIDLQAQLEVSELDLFSHGWNLEKLFEMYLNIDCQQYRRIIDNRPVLYLSEGRASTLQVGTDITKAENMVSEQGYSTTSGYKIFNDGITLKVTPRRVSSEVVACDIDLSVSKFQDTTFDGVPATDKNLLTMPGVLLHQSGVQFLASVKIKDFSNRLRLFGGRDSRADDVITIWCRIREIDLGEEGGT